MKNTSHGEIRTTRRDSLYGYYTAVNKGMVIPLERHEHFETVITRNYNFIHTVNGIACKPEVRDVVIHRPQDCHCAEPIDDTAVPVCRDIYIEPELFREACDYISPTLFIKITTEKAPPAFHLNDVELASFENTMDFSYIYAMAKDYEVYKSIKRIVACSLIGLYVKATPHNSIHAACL